MARSNVPVNTRKSVAVRDNAVTARAVSREASVDTSADLAVSAARSAQSQALVDPFQSLYQSSTSTYSVMAPEYNPYQLMKMPNECSILRQCIDAMVTNIDSFGYRLEYVGPPDQDEGPAAKAEKLRIEGLLDSPNGDYSFTELRCRIRRDLETFGYSYIEVGRESLNGDVVLLNHVPAQTMRMTAKEQKTVQVETIIQKDGKPVRAVIWKRFRRFVQQVGSRVVYFKEFGDPRIIDPRSGQEAGTNVEGVSNITYEQSANEIYHIMQYNPGSPYGVPRWISQLPSVLGLREAELTNLQFFKDNAIPAMAILCSGGAVTNSSVSNIENHFTSARGRESMNRVLVIEASSDDEAARVDSTIPTPKLEMKPLVSERQNDGHFMEYERACIEKVRSAFRIPPIFTGNSQDYTRATADTSLVIADAQVFGPERNREDEMYNSHFLPTGGKPLTYWQVRTNPPRLVSPDSVLEALETLDQVGALTPNIAIGIANELFDLHLTEIEQAWGDYPFAIVSALAQAGNLDGIQEIMIRLTQDDAEGTETDGQTDTDPNAPTKNKPKAKAQGTPNKPVTDDAKGDKATKGQIKSFIIKRFADVDVTPTRTRRFRTRTRR